MFISLRIKYQQQFIRKYTTMNWYRVIRNKYKKLLNAENFIYIKYIEIIELYIDNI